jgi:hypothetical protein
MISEDRVAEELQPVFLPLPRAQPDLWIDVEEDVLRQRRILVHQTPLQGDYGPQIAARMAQENPRHRNTPAAASRRRAP